LVRLSADEGHCYLLIQDDGVGFADDAAPRVDAFGLLGMRERILQLGGVLSIESAPGDGVTVTAKVPLSRIMVES
jgi:signal transduction histidine kinase